LLPKPGLNPFSSLYNNELRYTDCPRCQMATPAPATLRLRSIYESPCGVHMRCILPISQPLGLWTRPQRPVFTRNFAGFKNLRFFLRNVYEVLDCKDSILKITAHAHIQNRIRTTVRSDAGPSRRPRQRQC